MSWTETHERYRIIREVVTAAETDETGALPWREEYAAAFGTPDGLVTALRQRWQRTCEAQLESHLSDEELQERHRKLLTEHAAVLRVLDRYRYVPAKSAASLTTVA
jgi:hypothetical protein